MTKLLLLSACFALISHTFVCAEGEKHKDKTQENEQPADPQQ